MTNFEKHIKKAAEDYSLSDAEKARMERVLKSYMRFKPVRSAHVTHISTWSWIAYLHRPIAAALIFVLVTSGGITYAAEGALPGDVLYAVKTVVNEPVRVALAADVEAKAEVQMEIAERRIEEATTLAAEGRLDDTTQDELAASFKSYAAAATESIAKANTEEGAAIELAARFETRLVAHESVLAEVEMESMESDDDGTLRSHRLTEAVRETSERLSEERHSRAIALNINVAAPMAATVSEDVIATDAATTMTMSLVVDDAATATESASAKLQVASETTPTEPPAPTSAPSEKTISRMKSAAEKSLTKAEKTLRGARSLSAEARARAEADITYAGELVGSGKDYLGDDLRAEAFAAFEESLRVSEQAVVYIKAAPKLEKARARNASRNSDAGSGSSKGPTIEISLPGISVNATVTPTSTAQHATSSTSTDERKDDRDEENSDGNDKADHDDKDEIRDESDGHDDSGGSGLNILQRLNISL